MRIKSEIDLPLGEVANVVLGLKTASDVDKKQLAIGIAVEMEHTSDPREAEKIARDHLAEDEKYYTKPMRKNWGIDEARQMANEKNADDMQNSHSKSKEIVDYLELHNPTYYELTQAFGITLEQATFIIGNLKAHAFGPGGKGYVWFVKQVDRFLNDKYNKKKASIFVLDDDPVRIAIFKKAFDNKVVSTNNVKIALDLLRTHKFSKIFLDRDLSNPAENGEDVAWQMEREALCRTTPIVIHSENTRGQRVMSRYIGRYHSNVKVIPFNQLCKQLEKSEYEY